MTTVKRSTKKTAASNGNLDVEWADPPPTKRGSTRKSQWLPYLDEARKHPGKTLVLRSTNTAVATNIRSGKYAGVEAGEFEVTTRAVGDNKVDVYVTFVGKK